MVGDGVGEKVLLALTEAVVEMEAVTLRVRVLVTVPDGE